MQMISSFMHHQTLCRLIFFADKKKAADDKDREYRVMCTQVEKARKELEKCEKDVSVKTDRMTEAQKKYDRCRGQA